MEEGSSLWERLMHNFSDENENQEDVEREILALVQEGRERGFFAGSEGELISNVFEYSEKKAEDIMTHRKYIIGIDGNETLEHAITFIIQQNHSRFPVYDGDIDTKTTDSGMTTNNPTLQTTPTDDQFTNNGGRVDAVYIVATPGEIAFIKPMIAMRNGSQSGATLYASSRSAQGTAGPDFRLEMEGLQYSEIPMLAGGNLPLMQQALSAVNNDYSLARMYAMGVDAWSLANHFSQMRQVQGFEINGNTGSLTANPDCVINRKLSWLQYQQGQVVPAS